MTSYNPQEIEKKWHDKWEKSKLYSPDIQAAKKPFYNLMMFPYPSAEGLHAGNMYAFTGSDVYGRFKRMQGHDVFEPIGLDGFGIHSENYALKVGKSPAEHAKSSEKNFYKQMHQIGNGFDWSKTLETYDVDYYRWTQWLFVQMFKAGLAYKKKAPVNWCPSCKTVLADEQIFTPAQAGKWPKQYQRLEDVPEGVRVCERCGSEPERRELEQWLFRITDYADRLLSGLDKINWSQRVITAQKEWIGKKTGIVINYPVKGMKETISCFTTAPVNFGMTFIVLSPEHEFVHKILSGEIKIDPQRLTEVKEYVSKSLNKTEQQRRIEEKEKTGVFTGLYAFNSVAGKDVPIWIADFVIMGVGTGAVQGCPGHDYRDFEFAKKHNLPIIRVVVGVNNDTSEIDSSEKVIVSGMEGKMINSSFLDGMEFSQALQATMDHIEEKGWGKRVSTYHLRDWLVSRQRYWGAPIPMVYCPVCAKQGKSWLRQDKTETQLDHQGWDDEGWYPDENLPVELPTISDYKPEGNGKGPLANHPEFYKTKCPSCGSDAVRETDVSDTFVDSSWYFLRYPTVGSSTAATQPFDPILTKKWFPVDQYFGGAEHAVLHLMYARFVTMMLFDLKLLDFEEPFPNFYAHGLVIKDGAKMSKSRGNVVNPDEYIAKYGADALRLYLMFMGPMDGSPDFRDSGMEGMARFINRLWQLLDTKENQPPSNQMSKAINTTIKRVTSDIVQFKYNTAISAIMELANFLKKEGPSPEGVKNLTLLIAPFAPHLAEEIWFKLGHKTSVHLEPWPTYDESALTKDKLIVVVQVNGKVRDRLEVEAEKALDQGYVEQLATASDKVKGHLKTTKYRVVFVPGKLINFVV